MTGVLIKRRKYQDTHSKKTCDDRGRDWRDEAVNQGIPCKNWQPSPEARRASAQSQRECGSAVTWFHFQPPELGENKFLLFKSLSFWYSVTAALGSKYKYVLIVLNSVNTEANRLICERSRSVYLPRPILLITANDNLSPSHACIFALVFT